MDDDLDPADADALDDRTAASPRSSSVRPVELRPQRGRLRLRPAVVAEGYEGSAVSRGEIFEDDTGEVDDEKYQLLEEQLDLDLAGGLSISGRRHFVMFFKSKREDPFEIFHIFAALHS